ncbi:DUF4479 domain-containing protein [Aquibacillus koreensis]|uniref:DUF4479 domain-containing protein n=1 Tax=Aquibacillus koreensis TaxID=279446 RepID=A0A9X4AGU8_9BACI|nr:DUF4479 domain-containing tRNA-binding protein [Aquibacillus koreensis]MCT2535019.1 DUF4479 domain-containing protein [Aquibacillus koreensis]MDC3419306.1 DUF4479 domain-containing protein [Aquibacillus koreensis]
MDIFYNKEGIGDVLILPIKQGDRYETTYETFGDVVKITDKTSGELLGYNIFNASNYFAINDNGKISLTDDLLNEIRTAFEKNNLEDKLDIDLSPKFVVGFVQEKMPHENADKLSVCKVDVGDELLQIVCGAPNVDQGQKVVIAKVGAIMPSGMEIKPVQLRGIDSSGMICSQKELGLPNAPEEKGIYVLDDAYEIGQAFHF